jgi:tetratricopeptide (TPR) repeat protein
MQERERSIAELQRQTRDALGEGKVGAALEAAQAALDATVVYYGKAHPAYGAAVNNLALVRKTRGELEEAAALYDEAVEVYGKVTGRESASTATAQANAGSLHLALASKTKGVERITHVDTARSFLESALHARRAALGERHAMVGVSLYLLASAARLQRRYPEAEGLLKESVAVLRETVGDEHPAMATALNNLGYLLKEMKLYPRAEEAYAASRKIRLAAFGPAHPESVAVTHNLAECRRAAGDEDGALALQREILRALGHEEEAPAPPDARNVGV